MAEPPKDLLTGKELTPAEALKAEISSLSSIRTSTLGLLQEGSFPNSSFEQFQRDIKQARDANQKQFQSSINGNGNGVCTVNGSAGPQATIGPREGSMRDNLDKFISDNLERMGVEGRRAAEIAGRITGGWGSSEKFPVVDFIPGLNTALSADEAKRDFTSGNYIGAGINAIGIIPDARLLTDFVKGGAKTVERDLARNIEKDVSGSAAKDSSKTAAKDGANVAEKDAANTAEKNGAGADNNAIKEKKNPEEKQANKQDPKAKSEPVIVATGAYVESYEDFSLEGTLPVKLERYYGARLDLDGSFGRNRTCFLDATISVAPDNRLIYCDARGRRVWFDRPFNLAPARNAKYRHLALYAPWLKQLELQDRNLTYFFQQAKDKVYRLTKIEDRNGNSLMLARDAQHHILRADHSDGFALIFSNDARGLRTGVALQTVNGETSPLAAYRYDAARNLLNADCSTAFSIDYIYDAKNRLVQWNDSAGRTTSALDYDEEDRVVRVRTTGAFNNDLFEYDRANRITTYRPGGGEAFERFTFDEDENVLREENALGEAKTFTYENDYKTSETDAEGNSLRLAYDIFGNIKEAQDGEGRSTLYRWGTRGELDIIIDNEGNASKFDYDDRGNLLTATDATGGVTHYEWTQAGCLAAVTLPDGAREERRYDAHHRLIEVKLPNGGLIHYQRDAFGRVAYAADAFGNVTRYFYDAIKGKPFYAPTAIERPDGARISRSFDSEGQITTFTDGEGRTTRYAYGAFDQLVSITDPKGGVLRLSYDVRGELERVVNARGAVYFYERDLAGRVVLETDFDGRVIHYERDKAGRLIARLAPDGSKRVYTWDRSGRLKRVDAYQPNAKGILPEAPALSETFDYDDRGLLSKAANAAATVSFTRDNVGRVLCESQNYRQVQSRFNARGQRIAREIGFAAGWSAQGAQQLGFHGLTPEDMAAGYIVNPPVSEPHPPSEPDAIARYAYDPLGLIKQIAFGAEDAAHKLHFERDLLGRETARKNDGGFQLSQKFDTLHRLVEQKIAAGFEKSAQGYQRNFAYDKTSSPTQIIDDLWGVASYGYDRNGQITEARHGEKLSLSAPQREAARNIQPRLEQEPNLRPIGFGDEIFEQERFDYDAAHNIAANDISLSGEPLTRPLSTWLTTAGGKTCAARGPSGERIILSYDGCGRLIERRIEQNGFREQVWRYSWDALDRLIGCIEPNGDHWAYAYDPFGRRVEKRRLEKSPVIHGDRSRPMKGVRYIWDGDLIAEEIPFSAPDALDMEHRVVWHFEQGGFRPLARESANGIHYVICDHLGSPRELLTPTGDLDWAASYRTWGSLRQLWKKPRAQFKYAANGLMAYATTEEDEIDLCPVRFQGQWADEETGFYYNRFRHYDPLTGGYASPDPIGLAGGTRPQGYVHNPNAWIDPLGLADFEPKTLTDGFVYRGGSGSLNNLTPRPQDVSNGLSTYLNPTQTGPYTKLDISKLQNDFNVIQDGPNHVSITPKDGSMSDWAGAKGTEDNPMSQKLSDAGQKVKVDKDGNITCRKP